MVAALSAVGDRPEPHGRMEVATADHLVWQAAEGPAGRNVAEPPRRCHVMNGDIAALKRGVAIPCATRNRLRLVSVFFCGRNLEAQEPIKNKA
jgi:hypothetical protein